MTREINGETYHSCEMLKEGWVSRVGWETADGNVGFFREVENWQDPGQVLMDMLGAASHWSRRAAPVVAPRRWWQFWKLGRPRV